MVVIRSRVRAHIRRVQASSRGAGIRHRREGTLKQAGILQEPDTRRQGATRPRIMPVTNPNRLHTDKQVKILLSLIGMVRCSFFICSRLLIFL